ncbi:hypothetical protein [Rhodoferax sp.]|uniref:hypothetical protein n=1 Tax=Rhodoferax sp. TaxID=50421 RepID=UPI00272F3D14|nr:hypothetical protein [Rhodoferax sp.]MDP1530185.1 hypothetical protein [Rhodoferax sp.]MDP1945413.1 hypothetical protein [Rhodoferax sp.]MDP2443181.1 hypothetical protein [Rhodoferax sp.]MDZ4206705.1 hypothetical protein [Rhodoferax sp.]
MIHDGLLRLEGCEKRGIDRQVFMMEILLAEWKKKECAPGRPSNGAWFVFFLLFGKLVLPVDNCNNLDFDVELGFTLRFDAIFSIRF